MAAVAKIVCLTSVFTAWNSLWDFCDLTQRAWRWVIGLWIVVKKIERAPHAVHSRPIEYQWIRNGTGVMVRKPPYSFKRLVNVYKVRLNVYKIKR